jgi:hypothetical protein
MLGLELDVVVKRDILGFVDIYSKTFYLIFSAYYITSIFSVILPLLSFMEMQLMIYCAWCWYNWAQCEAGVEFLCYSKYCIVLCIQTVQVGEAEKNLNGYPTNAPSPLKSPTYERTKKFRCPVHSCGSLVVITLLIVSTLYNGLWSDSRSGPLPNNVLMYVMSSIF